MSAGRKIAYILKGYPRLSETFIANEVRRLGDLGVDLDVYAIKRGDDLAAAPDLPAAHYLPPVTSMSRTSLRSWLRANFCAFRPAQNYWLRHGPGRYVRTAVFAAAAAIRYRRAAGAPLKKTFIKEFLFATHIARRIEERGNITHIHAHFCHDATTVAWMVSRLTGIPFSFTAHAKDIYQKWLNPGDLLERKLAAAAFTVTCTRTNVDFLRARCDSPAKVHGIYHGLDVRLFAPPGRACTKDPRHEPRLVSVGRMVEKKGFIYLIDACRILHERGIAFSLDIIGERGDQTDVLANAIATAGLEARVRLLAPVAQCDLVDIYRNARAFVLPCVVLPDGDRDGIPNAMAEAMACAVPVVVTDVSGIPEIVESGTSGVVVPPRDSRALAHAIESLLADPGAADRIGRAARKRIESVFDADVTHKTLKLLFDSEIPGAAYAG